MPNREFQTHLAIVNAQERCEQNYVRSWLPRKAGTLTDSQHISPMFCLWTVCWLAYNCQLLEPESMKVKAQPLQRHFAWTRLGSRCAIFVRFCRVGSDRHILTWQNFDISAPSLTKSHPMELFCLALLAAQIWVSRLQIRKKSNGCLIMWPGWSLSPRPWRQFYQPKRFQKRCLWSQRWKGTRSTSSRYNQMQMQQHFQLAMEVVVILFCAAVLVFAWPRGTATWEMLVAIATIKHIIALHHLTNVNEFTCTAWILAFYVLFKYFPNLRRQKPRNPKKRHEQIFR